MDQLEDDPRAESSEDFKPLQLDIDDDTASNSEPLNCSSTNPTGGTTADTTNASAAAATTTSTAGGGTTGTNSTTLPRGAPSDARTNKITSETIPHGNLFIASLPPNSDEATVGALLRRFGDLESLRVVPDRHFAFAQFKTPAAAAACVEGLHGLRLPEATGPLHVAPAMHNEAADEVPNPRIFVRGLPPFATEATLRALGTPFGPLTEASVVVFPDGRCKGSGFLTFDSVAAATTCHRAINGATQRISVGDGSGATIDVKLTAKFSESQEAREARQRRNRERIAERASQGQSALHAGQASPPTSHRNSAAAAGASYPASATSAATSAYARVALKSAGGGGRGSGAGAMRTERGGYGSGGVSVTPGVSASNAGRAGPFTAPADSPHPPSAAIAFGQLMTSQHAPPPPHPAAHPAADAMFAVAAAAVAAGSARSGIAAPGGSARHGRQQPSAHAASNVAAGTALSGGVAHPGVGGMRTLVLCGSTPAFPRSGDVFLGPLGVVASADGVVELVTNVADAPMIVAPFRAKSGETGFAFRLRNPDHVASVVGALNGASFLGGASPSLSCWRFA